MLVNYSYSSLLEKKTVGIFEAFKFWNIFSLVRARKRQTQEAKIRHCMRVLLDTARGKNFLKIF